MQNKQPALGLPEVAVLAAIVDQHIARVAVFPLQGRRRRDDGPARKVALRPATFLRLGPGPGGHAGQDDRRLVANRTIERKGVRQWFEAVEEVVGARQASPEFARAVPLFERVGRQAQEATA